MLRAFGVGEYIARCRFLPHLPRSLHNPSNDRIAVFESGEGRCAVSSFPRCSKKPRQ